MATHDWQGRPIPERMRKPVYRPPPELWFLGIAIWAIVILCIIIMIWGFPAVGAHAQDQGGWGYFGPSHADVDQSHLTPLPRPRPMKGETHGHYMKRTGARHPRPAVENSHGRKP